MDEKEIEMLTIKLINDSIESIVIKFNLIY